MQFKSKKQLGLVNKHIWTKKKLFIFYCSWFPNLIKHSETILKLLPIYQVFQ